MVGSVGVLVGWSDFLCWSVWLFVHLFCFSCSFAFFFCFLLFLLFFFRGSAYSLSIDGLLEQECEKVELVNGLLPN